VIMFSHCGIIYSEEFQKQEMEVYEDEFGGSIKNVEDIRFLSEISTYVLLDDEPKNCKLRVESLRKNESESSIPIDYYEGIDDIHFDIFIRRIIPKRISKVLVLSWGQYDSEKELWDKLEEVLFLKERNAPSTVIFEENLNLLECNKENCKIYQTEGEVLASYRLFSIEENMTECNEQQLKSLFRYQKIYISQNIMQISDRKSIVQNDYNVWFYKNEYKRVVLRHLSHSQAIHFY